MRESGITRVSMGKRPAGFSVSLENLKEEIDILGPQLAKNVYTSQRKIVDAVRSLEEAGEIVIAGGGGENEVIA